MKDQYFADSRDALKYDFWLELASNVPGIERLAFIPMLTPPDGTGQGGHRNYSKVKANGLLEFLTLHANKPHRSIALLRDFMRRSAFAYSPYCDAQYFTHAERDAYFDQIPSELLHNAAVLIDPDTGLEPDNTNYMVRCGQERYLLYREVKALLRRATGATFLLVYQHLQRNAHLIAADLQRRTTKLAALTPAGTAMFLQARDIGLLAVSGNRCTMEHLTRACSAYASEVGLIGGAQPAI